MKTGLFSDDEVKEREVFEQNLWNFGVRTAGRAVRRGKNCGCLPVFRGIVRSGAGR